MAAFCNKPDRKIKAVGCFVTPQLTKSYYSYSDIAAFLSYDSSRPKKLFFASYTQLNTENPAMYSLAAFWQTLVEDRKPPIYAFTLFLIETKAAISIELNWS